MEYKILPCGCSICCTEDENKILLCISHNNEYQFWNGDDEDFIRSIVTPRANQIHVDDEILDKLR